MELITVILIALCLVVGTAGLICVVALLIGRKKQSAIEGGASEDAVQQMLDVQQDQILSALQETIGLLKETIAMQTNGARDTVISSFNASNHAMIGMMQPYMDRFASQIETLSTMMQRQLEETRVEMKDATAMMRRDVTDNLRQVREDSARDLQKLREDNNKQLETMRATVDEKLSSTLDQRVKSAFEQVSARLDAVQQGFGEMRQLSNQVTNLNKVFTNVKTRGGWGEVALESLLEQILTPEQYKRQFKLNKRKGEMVDFAIVMPGQNDEELYLPIDAKFPLEDYERLVEASENGSVEQIRAARKALADAVKKQARSIAEKYVIPPVTTNFAVMYLPIEGLYAEVVKDGALCSDLQTNFRVTVCGPTTVTALLNSLQTGFTTLKIQKRSGEIVKLLNAFRKDFSTFTGLIDKVKGNAEKVVESLDQVNKRNEIIKKKLDKVGDDELELLQKEAGAIEVAADSEEGE